MVWIFRFRGAQKISSRHNSWQGVAEADEFQAFFDCYETREEMLQRVNSGEGPSGTGPRRYPLERIRSGEGQRSLGLVPEVWFGLSGVEDFRGCFAGPKVKIHEIFLGGVNTCLLRAPPQKKGEDFWSYSHHLKVETCFILFYVFLLPRYHGHLSNHPFNKTGPLFFRATSTLRKKTRAPRLASTLFMNGKPFVVFHNCAMMMWCFQRMSMKTWCLYFGRMCEHSGSNAWRLFVGKKVKGWRIKVWSWFWVCYWEMIMCVCVFNSIYVLYIHRYTTFFLSENEMVH